jgi:riboflavin synthase
MFTGIVKRLAPLVSIRPTPSGARLTIDLGDLADAGGRGDSFCINGACLTLTAKHGTLAEFDVVAETLSLTTLGQLKPGDRVNVEPSLRVGDQLGGHFVLGHIDGVGRIISLTPSGDSATLTLAAGRALTDGMVHKGSVALDGISLTLASVEAERFACAIIPTTLQDTTLSFKRAGDAVNIETDILGKMVAKAIGRSAPTGTITLDTLKDAGYL